MLAAVLATIGAALFGFMFPEGYASASMEGKREALSLIIYGYTAVTAATGVYVWFVLSDGHPSGQPNLEEWNPKKESAWMHITRVLRMPSVWLTSVIVVCAYVGYKGFDNYSLFAVEGFGLGQVEAASIAAEGAWMRPVAALAAGFLGDRFLVSRMTVICFGILLVSQLFFAIFTPSPGMAWVLLTNILIGSSAIFGLRSLYYALFEEARVPAAVTGTAVGLVSVLGYTPDIFVSYIGGVLLDRSPGLPGHQHYYFFLAGFACLGLLVSYVLMRRLRN
jgi:nitrate/nitrite transporter NarK